VLWSGYLLTKSMRTVYSDETIVYRCSQKRLFQITRNLMGHTKKNSVYRVARTMRNWRKDSVISSWRKWQQTGTPLIVFNLRRVTLSFFRCWCQIRGSASWHNSHLLFRMRYAKHLRTHLRTHRLRDNPQSTYCTEYSTRVTFLNVHHDIATALDDIHMEAHT